METIDILRSLSFGERVAEEENTLENYFVETNQWTKISQGYVDVVYGPKGSGKSALYYLLLKKQAELNNRGIVLIAGENPRGETAFRALVADPPTTEQEFVGIWKLYIATLIGRWISEKGITGEHANKLIGTLNDAGLLKTRGTLQNTLLMVRNLIRRLAAPAAIETEVRIDPTTGQPVGVIGRLALNSSTATSENDTSIDDLLYLCNKSLESQKCSVWVLLDRLDVAFAESKELEENALRALFKVYLDIRNLEAVTMKIFLRDDIWRRITDTGFREASHITRHITIRWDRRSLLNLIVKRAIQSQAILDRYDVLPHEILSSGDAQKLLFYRMFPEQVEKGSRRPNTLDWIVTRTADGTKTTVPREVIHLLNSTIAKQLDILDVGGYEPDEQNLVAGQAFKEALPDVSKARLEQTLYAEYPSLKRRLEKLRSEKTMQSVSSLATIWNISEAEAHQSAMEMVNVGFFEERGTKGDPEFWVPFLYRDALDMVQGAAE